jgi:Undecaprenyl-phosphate galactose phosphotransferase WbaP
MKPEIIFQDPSFYSGNGSSYWLKYRRQVMSAFLLVSDLLAIGFSIWIAIILWSQIRADLQVNPHLAVIPAAMLFLILIYRLLGLYPGIGIGPVEELKRLTISTSFVTFSMITLSFFLRSTTVYSRATLAIAWAFILISVPISRKVFRRIALKLGFWGLPVAIVGDEKNVMHLQHSLGLHPLNGLWPVICLNGPARDVFKKEEKTVQIFSLINTVILAAGQGKVDLLRHLLTQTEFQFQHIILIVEESRGGPIWSKPINLAEYMGLEVAHNLLNKGQQFGKRAMEIAIILFMTPALIILFTLISAAIGISSPGPIFYKHKRIGRNGDELWIWKFRTMVHNADKILKEHLTNNPRLATEWKESFKLKIDPRITSIGRLLRLTSLDELPQVWNVLRGEMSLIGPRPIVEEEIPLYGGDFEIYKQVLPGITGLWQISGRNNLPYQDRVILDVHYIQNWSVWLDIHIMLHTVIAVIQARGAY